MNSSVDASVQNQETCVSTSYWESQRLDSFEFLYSAENVNLAQEIIGDFGEQIEIDYDNYSRLFNAGLETPITIRLYPSLESYECLNVATPTITERDFHSHVGSREVALIANAINQNGNRESLIVNSFRHELAILFADKVSGGYAPPGLLLGIGGYFENPSNSFESWWREAGEISVPDKSLQRLWEEEIPASSKLNLLQSTSSVSFFIDIYGWERLLHFLSALESNQGYRQSLEQIYDGNLQDIQREWQDYFPLYISERWQFNIQYFYDLQRYELLIKAGAYEDSVEGLLEAQRILGIFSPDQLSYVNELLAKAQKGVKASDLALKSRQAILDGEYLEGYDNANQALQLYNELGDNRRISEVESYQNISLEVLTLREEVEGLSDKSALFDPVKTQRLASIGQRLSELGDKEGVRQVQVSLIIGNSGQEKVVGGLTIVGIIISLVILWIRFRRLQTVKFHQENLF